MKTNQKPHGTRLSSLPDALVPSPQGVPRYILNLTCASAAGKVAAVTCFLEARNCYIDEISVFDDSINQAFFMRCVFHAESGGMLPLSQMQGDFETIGGRFGMTWSIHDATVRPAY